MRRGVVPVVVSLFTTASVVASPAWSPGPAAPAGLEARAGHGMAFDATRGVVVAFGGYDGATFYDDTWEYDGTAWTAGAVPPPALTGRAYGAMAFDAGRSVAVYFGGNVGSLATFGNETWEYDGLAWSQGPAAPVGLTGRAYLSMAYDAARQVAVIFGGQDGAVSYGETWEYDGTAWVQGPAAPAGLTSRYGHALAFDAARGVSVLFGGFDGAFKNDTWEYDGTAWTAGPAAPAGLTGRANLAATYDADRARTVLFGGQAGITYQNETWEYDGATTWVAGATPPAGLTRRRFVGLAHDSARLSTVLFGGQASVGGYQSQTWELACGAITISPPTLPDGDVGQGYLVTLAAAGGTAPYTYAVTSGALPPGLALDPATGVLSGTPTASGSFGFTVTARDAAACGGSQAYTLMICAITMAPATLPNATIGVAYSQTITASGGSAPYTYAVTSGGLPPGLALDSGTGVLDGTPASLGTFTFTVTATDAAGCAGSQGYTVDVRCPFIAIGPAVLPDASEGAAYSQQLTASGGTAPYTFAQQSGTLPTGLTLSAAGLLSGTPTASGAFTFAVVATDASGCTGQRSFTLQVLPAGDYVLGEGLGQPNGNGVRVYRRDGTPAPTSFLAYGAGQWGTNVAAGDVNGGTTGEILTGPGPGPVYGPQVRAFLRDGTAVAKVNFYAYGTLRYGVNVSAGDLEADAFAEIVSGAGPGAVFGPHVRAFDFDGGTLGAMGKVSFYAYGTLKYGVNVAGGDLDGDGYGELLSGPGPGAIFGPTVRGFNFDNAAIGSIAKINFNAFSTLQYGVNVAAGDVEADGFAEIAAAPGPGAGSQFPSRFLGFDFDALSVTALTGFDVTPFTTFYGGRVGAGDLSGDLAADLVTGAGRDPAADATVRAYAYQASVLVPLPGSGFTPFSTNGYGVNVAEGALGYY